MRPNVLKKYKVIGASRFMLERHESVDSDTYDWYVRHSIRPEYVTKDGVVYLRPGHLTEGWSLDRWIFVKRRAT